ncbi:MAG: ABC transporter permease component [Candidatus Brocadia fulgida]|uniref:ABC transporter permease component n=1 Tax=Candidatus Brocadia fulgida TaxID=380242 RepID=A0A0M2UWG1_9BACT|nr:MAG: ABC transporter permease component [Candidatus Brocadia fulgida]
MANSPEDIVSALSVIIVVMTLLPVVFFLAIFKHLVRDPLSSLS